MINSILFIFFIKKQTMVYKIIKPSRMQQDLLTYLFFMFLFLHSAWPTLTDAYYSWSPLSLKLLP